MLSTTFSTMSTVSALGAAEFSSEDAFAVFETPAALFVVAATW
jgi:hypothetical protein